MPYYFTCPHCLNKTLVSEQLSGQRGACVGCGKPVTIPPAPQIIHEHIAPAELRDSPTVVELKPRRFSPKAVKVVLFFILATPLLIFGGWSLSPAIVRLKSRRDVVACQQNLQRIAKALNAYAADYGTYPPPAVLNANGQPMHSWRVLILPYLGERSLYKRYDFTTAWDSSTNAHILAQIPPVFICPAKANASMIGESSYMLVTGAGTLFPKSGPLGPKAVTDGQANTLLLVETNNSSIAWTDPRDLELIKLPAQIGALGGIGGSHQGGATVVFVDGQPGWLPVDANKTVVDGLLTPQGGEAVLGTWYRK